MSNGNLQLQGEKSKEMYPHSVPHCQVKRFVLKKRSCLTSRKYVETNSKVQKTSSNSTHGILSPSASASTSKLVSHSTSSECVETNANFPNTVTNLILPTSSLSEPACQSTSMFVHNTQSNHMVDKTAQNMASYPTATFSSCSSELIGYPAPSVTTMSYKLESTHTVPSASVSNTNIHTHPQLRTASNTIETHATVIPTSTLKLNLSSKIKLPPNIQTLASRGILKSTKSIPLKKRVTFEDLISTVPAQTTEKTSEEETTVKNPPPTLGVSSSAMLVKNTHFTIVQNNCEHSTPTLTS